jgi:hypothetical protein
MVLQFHLTQTFLAGVVHCRLTLWAILFVYAIEKLCAGKKNAQKLVRTECAWSVQQARCAAASALITPGGPLTRAGA